MNRQKNEITADQANCIDSAKKAAPDPESTECNRDPEARLAHTKEEIREKTLDKTLADSFPTSDPPSSIPNPSEEDSSEAA